MKRTLILSFALVLLFASQPSISNAATGDSNPLTVYISSNGIPETSAPAGKVTLARIFLADTKNIGSNRIAKPVTFSFTPTDSTITPISEIVALQGNNSMVSSSGVSTPTYYGTVSFTPNTSGTLKVDFAGDTDYPAATFTRYLDIWTPQARSYVDQIDQLKGFQVHAVYVVPSDAIDAGRDTSGQISSWLMQGARWLGREAGDHWQYDTYNNIADITYFHSAYSTSVLSDSPQSTALKLLREMGKKLPVGANRKTYLFFIETPAFNIVTTDKDYANGELCGLADSNPSRLAIIATGNPPVTASCSGYTDIADWQAMVAVHETIHTFGVGHVLTPTDIMLKVPDNAEMITLDKTSSQYFGASKAGANIETLPIWSLAPSANKPWPCIWEQSNSLYLCKTGTTYNVDAYPANCWQKANTTLVLQMKIGSKWTAVPKPQGSKSKTTKGASCSGKFPVSYSMTLSSLKTGTSSYRFVARGWTGSTFSVIYQN